MHTDRELLELAAKAAGISIDPIDAAHEPSEWMTWNPLDDDGDALRLASSLRIDLDWQRDSPPTDEDPGVEAYCRADEGFATYCPLLPSNDYRRAIVMVAADIGSKLP